MAITYILYSLECDRYYIGHTESSIEERLKKHLADHTGFTSRAKDWACVWQKSFATKVEAYACERELKKLKSRRAIEKLIKGV